jgi:tetratricopeptide (TPR) repeat protein
MGFILLEQGDLEGAQKELEQAVTLDPENVDALFDLARTYAREKQTEKAMRYFERVLPLSPDNTQAHYQLFLLYTRSKQQDKANAELEVFHRLEDMEKMVRREESLLTKARKARAEQSNPERTVPQAPPQTAPPANQPH